jgi:hypothetical protein
MRGLRADALSERRRCVALTVVLALGVIAGWRCSAGSSPAATVAPSSSLGKIAYVLDGDIWTKTLPNGAPHNITHLTAADRAANTTYWRPAWSPSGAWLIVWKGKQPGVMRSDGSDARLYNVPAVAWSPTNDQLAYNPSGNAQSGSQGLVVEDATGLNRDVIARCFAPAGETCGMTDITWRSDGSEVAYVEHHQRPGAQIERTYEAIKRIGATGVGLPEVAYAGETPPRDGLGMLSWNYLYGMLVYRIPGFTADLADGVTVEELHDSVRDRLFALAPAGPVLLLDRSLLSSVGEETVLTDGTGRQSWTDKRIAIVSVATGISTGVTPANVAAVQPALFSTPHHDADALAYSAAPDAGLLTGDASAGAPAKAALALRKIWVMRDFHAEPRQLTSDPAYRDEFPQWSADGSQILFARLDAHDHWSLWLVPSTGGTPVRTVERIDWTAPLKALQVNDPPAWLGYYGTIAWRDVLDWWWPRR